MRYMVRKSIIDVVGRIWMPSITAAMTYTLRAYDVENMRADDGTITRDSVEQWLACNSGDFQNIADFHASIEDGDTTVDIPWTDEDSELTFSDCMSPAED